MSPCVARRLSPLALAPRNLVSFANRRVRLKDVFHPSSVTTEQMELISTYPG